MSCYGFFGIIFCFERNGIYSLSFKIRFDISAKCMFRNLWKIYIFFKVVTLPTNNHLLCVSFNMFKVKKKANFYLVCKQLKRKQCYVSYCIIKCDNHFLSISKRVFRCFLLDYTNRQLHPIVMYSIQQVYGLYITMWWGQQNVAHPISHIESYKYDSTSHTEISIFEEKLEVRLWIGTSTFKQFKCIPVTKKK